MSVKLLPVKEPMITSYPDEANFVSILTNYDHAIPWLYCNYIQLHHTAPRGLTMRYHNWYNRRTSPYIQFQRISKPLLEKSYPDRIIPFLKECLDQDLYIHMFVNYKHISNTASFQKQDRIHNIFIYGYDDEKQILNVADHSFGNGKYARGLCSYTDMENAYWGIDSQIRHDQAKYLNASLELFKFNDRSQQILFSLQSCIDQLEDYYHSRNSDTRSNCYCNDQDLYGFQAFDAMYALYAKVESKEYHFCDLRTFHLLAERKEVMVSRLIFISEHFQVDGLASFIESYKQLTESWKAVLLKAMKFNMTHKLDIIREINEHTRDLVEVEKEVLRNMLPALHQINDDHIQNKTNNKRIFA